MTNAKKTQIIEDVILGHDYFKIEQVYPLKITKSFIATFTDKEGNFNWIRLKKHRLINYKQDIPLNHGFPIMEEEINEIIKRDSEGESLTNLQRFFQRPYKTITKIIENFSNNIANKQTLENYLLNKEIKILNSIINGYNPKTGKQFDINSIWKNKNILNDLTQWSNEKIENNFELTSNSKKTVLETPTHKSETQNLKQSEVKIEKAYNLSNIGCVSCGKLIPMERLKIVPLTKFCVNCAPNQKNRKFTDSWGSREDWNKDRSSWKRTN